LINKRKSKRRLGRNPSNSLPAVAGHPSKPKSVNAELALVYGFTRMAELFENLQRKPFLISELVAIARELRPYAEAEARRRKAHGNTAPGRNRSLNIERFRARDFVCRCVGMSYQTLRKAELVVDAAARDPSWRACVDLMDRSGKVAEALRGMRLAGPPLVRRAFDARQFVQGIIAAAFGTTLREQGRLPLGFIAATEQPNAKA
jgi:hypothetical protein